MSFNFTQARGHVPSSFLTLGHWAEKEEKLKEEEDLAWGFSAHYFWKGVGGKGLQD